MTDTTALADSFIEAAARPIRDGVHKQARDLRLLADDLDRCVRDNADVFLLAAQAHRTLTWGVANIQATLPLSWLRTYHQLATGEQS